MTLTRRERDELHAALTAALQAAEAEIEGMKDALVLIRDRAAKSRADWDDGAVIHSMPIRFSPMTTKG